MLTLLFTCNQVAYGSHCQCNSTTIQSSIEYLSHRHLSLFVNMVSSESESGLWDEEAILNIPGDASSIAFEFQHATAHAVSSCSQHLSLSACPFISELGPISVVKSTSGTMMESESDYASFLSAESNVSTPSEEMPLESALFAHSHNPGGEHVCQRQ